MGGTHIGCGIVEDEHLLASTAVASSGAHGLNSLLGTIGSTRVYFVGKTAGARGHAGRGLVRSYSAAAGGYE